MRDLAGGSDGGGAIDDIVLLFFGVSFVFGWDGMGCVDWGRRILLFYGEKIK
jgi:hypothetical protein